MLTTSDIYPIIIYLYHHYIWNIFVVSTTSKYKALLTLQERNLASNGVIQNLHELSMDWIVQRNKGKLREKKIDLSNKVFVLFLMFGFVIS